MGKKKRRAGKSNEDAWKQARRSCRLTARQVEMARRLGMNPDRLPRLRPSPSQRWKLPVGEFIEELYEKRFGDADGAAGHQPPPARHSGSTSGAQTRDGAQSTAGAVAQSEREISAVENAHGRTASLIVYLANLTDDLESLLASRRVDQAVLAELGGELHRIAEQLVTGSPVSECSSVEGLAGGDGDGDRASGSESAAFDGDDDDIPF